MTRHRLAPLGALLASRGLDPVHVPLLVLEPTGDPPPPGRPDLVLVSSASTAEHCPRLVEAVGDARVVAVGPRTAAALRARGLRVHGVGESDAAEAVDLAQQLLAGRSVVGGKRPVVWTIGAELSSQRLDDALAAWDQPVARWSVYRRAAPSDATAQLQAAGPVDVAVFTSPSAVQTWAASDPPPARHLLAIGATTEQALRDLGLPVAAVAAKPSFADLADAAARVVGL